jgi:FAD:protein FMN transferase
VPAADAASVGPDPLLTMSSARPSSEPTKRVVLNAGPFAAELVKGEDTAMGTHLAYAAFTTRDVDAAAIRRAFADATAEIRRLEALMTTWRPDSEVSRINAGAGKDPIKVSKETLDVVAESLRTSEMSEGTFDITFQTLHGLWKFDQDLDPHPPTDEAIKARLALLGWRHVKLDREKQTIYLDKAGVKIGLGGIAKGYAVDRAADVLARAGLPSFFVQAGGDLYTRGKKADGSDWVAGVRDPRGPADDYFVVLPVSDHAFSTAGDYERSYITGGKRYHHIIDPRTGHPATACRSVTIWAPTAFLADGIDDAVFILGPEKGLKLVESIEGVGAVIVDAKNNVFWSKRLDGKLKFTHPPTDGI